MSKERAPNGVRNQLRLEELSLRGRRLNPAALLLHYGTQFYLLSPLPLDRRAYSSSIVLLASITPTNGDRSGGRLRRVLEPQTRIAVCSPVTTLQFWGRHPTICKESSQQASGGHRDLPLSHVIAGGAGFFDHAVSPISGSV